MLTGFLGAGKTTLLNRLLRDPSLADTVVIVNEFGEVGIDHFLVETVDEDLVLLSAGCLCCSVRGDLVQTLEDLLRRRDNGRIKPFRRAVIETTGLADPAPVLAAVLYHPYLSIRYALGGVVTLVDAVNGLGNLDRYPEALRQAAVADRLVLSKTDLAGDTSELEKRLRRLNPTAPIIRAVSGEAAAAEIMPSDLFNPDGKIADVSAWLGLEAATDHHDQHHHDVNRHDERIVSFVLTSDRPLTESAFDMFLDILTSTFGPKILRLKGLVAFRDKPDQPVVVHGVQHVLHVPAVLPGWPDADRRTRLVLIVDDIPKAAIEKLWNAFVGLPAPDQPDGTALADNPLAPSTMARSG